MAPLRGLSRRGFLGAGAVGVGLLGAAAGWLWFGGQTGYRKRLAGAVPTTLSVRELATLEALADAMITAAPGAPTAAQAMVARRLDRELAFHHGGKLVSDIKASLALMEFLPVIEMKGARFTELSSADAARFLESCGRSSWSLARLSYAGIKFALMFFYYSDDRTWRSIGYAGPMVPEKPYEGGNRIANLASAAGGQARGG